MYETLLQEYRHHLSMAWNDLDEMLDKRGVPAESPLRSLMRECVRGAVQAGMFASVPDTVLLAVSEELNPDCSFEDFANEIDRT